MWKLEVEDEVVKRKSDRRHVTKHKRRDVHVRHRPNVAGHLHLVSITCFQSNASFYWADIEAHSTAVDLTVSPRG
eukprot:scaffold41743_cov133-Skeletonema_dohrnii-CCMP3373.AAC.2